LALAGSFLVPSSSSAQGFPGSRAATAGASWFVALWDQLIDRLVPLSDAGIQIDGNGFASQITAQAGIQIDGNGTPADAGIQIDGNGRPAATTN
jgi:hypothetical protein